MTKSKVGTKGKVTPERLAIVAQLMIRGTDRRTIQHTLAAEWKTTTRTIRRYEEKVRADWRAQHKDIDPGLQRATISNRLDDLYFLARGAGVAGAKPDIRLCNQILRTRAMVFVPAKLQVEHDIPNGIQVTGAVTVTVDSARRALAKRLAAALAKK